MSEVRVWIAGTHTHAHLVFVFIWAHGAATMPHLFLAAVVLFHAIVAMVHPVHG